MTTSTQKKLYVPVSQSELDLLDSMIPTVAQMPLVLELGISVSRSTVARMALVRGLRSLESTGGSAEKPEPEPAPTATSQKPADAAPQEPQEVDNVPTFDLDSKGLIKPPDGWERWSDNEMVPQSQGDVHTYYTNHGWERWWGTSGRENISFYWNRNPDAEELSPWPNKGPNGGTIKKQTTPWGEGHIIPHGW